MKSPAVVVAAASRQALVRGATCNCCIAATLPASPAMAATALRRNPPRSRSFPSSSSSSYFSASSQTWPAQLNTIGRCGNAILAFTAPSLREKHQVTKLSLPGRFVSAQGISSSSKTQRQSQFFLNSASSTSTTTSPSFLLSTSPYTALPSSLLLPSASFSRSSSSSWTRRTSPIRPSPLQKPPSGTRTVTGSNSFSATYCSSGPCNCSSRSRKMSDTSGIKSSPIPLTGTPPQASSKAFVPSSLIPQAIPIDTAHSYHSTAPALLARRYYHTFKSIQQQQQENTENMVTSVNRTSLHPHGVTYVSL